MSSNYFKDLPVVPESYYKERRYAFRSTGNKQRKYYVQDHPGVTYDGENAQRAWNFIHIPKCAGTYFMHSVRPMMIPSPYKRIDNEVHSLGHGFNYIFQVSDWSPNVDTFEVTPGVQNQPWMRIFDTYDHLRYITIVRNPFDLLYSYWRYKPSNSDDWAPKDRPISGWFNCNNVMGTHTFHSFVEHYLEPKDKWHVTPFKYNLFAQLYRCPEPWNDPTAEFTGWRRIPNLHVLRFESLEADINRWALKHNKMLWNPPQKYHNRSPSNKPYREMYTTSQVRRLSLLWKPQLEEFGYEY